MVVKLYVHSNIVLAATRLSILDWSKIALKKLLSAFQGQFKWLSKVGIAALLSVRVLQFKIILSM